MPDAVACAECGNQYDSDKHPFCPRCGSVRNQGGRREAFASSERRRPHRRRAQMGGAMLLAIGMVVFLMAAAMLLFAGQAADDLAVAMAQLPGGEVQVQILAAGEPLEGVPVALLAPNGTRVAEAVTDAAGHAVVPLGDSALAYVQAQHAGSTWNRTVVASQGVRTDVGIDVDEDPLTSGAVAGMDGVLRLVRIFIGAVAGLGLMMALGGVAALRLRKKPLAYAGLLAGLLPTLLVLVGTFPQGILFTAPYAVATWLIIQGRRSFDD